MGSTAGGALCDQTTALPFKPSILVTKCTPCAQLPVGSSVIQMMENPLFFLKSHFDPSLCPCPTHWVNDIIIGSLGGLGLFVLLLPYLKNNVSSPPPRKHEDIRKHQIEPKVRRKNNKKNRAWEDLAYCLEAAEVAQALISLLHSPPGPGGSWLQLVPHVSCHYLVKFRDNGSFHQLSCQDPICEMCKAEPAGAHQPCGEPAEEAVPAICPSAALAPPTQGSLPVASTLSTEHQDPSNLNRITLGTVAKSSSPESEAWQEHLSHQPPGAPFSGGPTAKQVKTGSPPFVNPEVQKLLQILITKKVKPNICREKEKDGSFSEQMSSDDHLNTLGNMRKSLGAEQDNTTPQFFWNMKDKTEQRPGPRQLLHSEVLRDHLEQKYSQLYWGLPSMHSDSLVATRSSSQHQAPFVSFSGVSNGFPLSIQPRIPLGPTQAPVLPCPGVPPQPFTQNWPPCQPPPLAQIQAQPYLPSSLLFRPPYSPPQMSTCGLGCPTFQNNTLNFIPTETQCLKCPLLQKQLKSGAPSPSVVKRSQKAFSQLILNLPQERGRSQAQRSVSIHHEDLTGPDLQKQHLQKRLIKDETKRGLALSIHLSLSLELSSPQCHFLRTYQAQGKQGPWQPSAFTGKRRLDRQKIRSRCPRRSHRKGQMQFQPGKDFGKGLRPCLRRISKASSRARLPGKDFGKGLRPCLRRISKASSRARLPVKFLHRNSERKSERYLMTPLKSNSGHYLPSSPEEKHLEKNLKAHLSTKLRQISQGFIPVIVRQSWLVAKCAFSKPHPHKELRNLASLKHWKPCVDSSHELSFLSPRIRHMLEAHVIRWQEGRLPYQMPTVNCMGRRWENGTVLGFPSTRKTLSPPTKSVAQHPKEPCLKTQVAQGRATGELLQDSHTEVLLLAHILASHRSLSSSHRENAIEDAPAFQVVPYDLNVSEQSSQGQQKFKKPILKDSFQSQSEMSAPTDEWRGCKKLQPGKHEEMKSQREMLASAEGWRGFTKPQPGQHEETKSQSKMPAPAEEWRCVRRLQPGEREETRSNQGQQEPRKPKVRDPWKGQFASTDEREDDWRPKPGEYKERSSGLKASQASGMSHTSQVRERGESLGSKHPQLSPGKRELSPESPKRMRHFLQYLSHDKKGKGIEESLQKGKPASATAHHQKPIKGKLGVESRAIDPCAIGRAVGQVLGEKLGPRQGLCASELNQHPGQLQVPA
ncbi:spermatogenesis-associated protein 31E1-like [Mesoplodon densirostris]|uniref:spermatogenesis-associated protein 31E1-like n=1 Tax=Mesoplodon densirostris TaxID=48708 RepID=UPI0028DB016B|nr:spermatogenesis-associated protein 31E1-like [Mesoplodon densirostris]